MFISRDTNFEEQAVKVRNPSVVTEQQSETEQWQQRGISGSSAVLKEFVVGLRVWVQGCKEFVVGLRVWVQGCKVFVVGLCT
jgi:hypothetical protein